MNCNELIECPICHQKMKSLISHIPHVHSMSISNFRKKFPEVGRLQLHLRKITNEECEYCGRHFEYHNCLQAHIKHEHPDHYVSEITKKEGHLICKICGKDVNQLFNHVRLKHRITWKQYCLDNNWDMNRRSYFSEEHIRHLSENKKKFYCDTERGEELRKKQSIMYSGSGNPAKKPEVRNKISLSASKRCSSGVDCIKYNQYGMHIVFTYRSKKYHCRSFEEFKTMTFFLKNDIAFEYEHKIVKYIDDNGKIRNYVLDFFVDNKYMIELKCDNEKVDYFKQTKYRQVRNNLSKIGLELRILNYRQVCSLFNNAHIDKDEPFKFLRKLLDEDSAKVYYVKGKHRKSRILRKVDENYENNKNIFLKGEM